MKPNQGLWFKLIGKLTTKGNSMDGDRILSLEEAAHYLGLKAHALRKRLKAHHGPEFQRGGVSAHRIFSD